MASGNRLQFMASKSKLRGVPRRLRTLRRWADSFEGWFPGDHDLRVDGGGRLCWYQKVPVDWRLGQSQRLRSASAQCVLDAGSNLLSARPSTVSHDAGALIGSTSHIFGSEVFVYAEPVELEGEPILDRSLAHDWGLRIPPNLVEYGRRRSFYDDDPPSETFVDEVWWYLSGDRPH